MVLELGGGGGAPSAAAYKNTGTTGDDHGAPASADPTSDGLPGEAGAGLVAHPNPGCPSRGSHSSTICAWSASSVATRTATIPGDNWRHSQPSRQISSQRSVPLPACAAAINWTEDAGRVIARRSNLICADTCESRAGLRPPNRPYDRDRPPRGGT